MRKKAGKSHIYMFLTSDSPIGGMRYLGQYTLTFDSSLDKVSYNGGMVAADRDEELAVMSVLRDMLDERIRDLLARTVKTESRDRDDQKTH